MWIGAGGKARDMSSGERAGGGRKKEQGAERSEVG